MLTIAAVLFALAATAPAPAPPAPALPSADEWREDVAVLREVFEVAHPGLHRYRTDAELQDAYARLEREFIAARNYGEAYVALTRFTSQIECGHTFPNPTNQKKAIAAAVFRATPRVPFYFRWLDGRMIVTRDASGGAGFTPGMEIRAINGVAASKILETLLPLARADGANRAKRISNLEVRPENRWETFDVLYPLLFNHSEEVLGTPRNPEEPAVWGFDVRLPDGTQRTITAAPVTDDARLAVRDESLRGAKPDAPPWTLSIDGHRAVMTMPTWVTFNDHWDWQGWLRDAFTKLNAAGVRQLVIDLRVNEGGSAVGDVILAHLATKPVSAEPFGRYLRYQKIPPKLVPVLDTWDRSFDDRTVGTRASRTKPGFYEILERKEDSTIVEPRTPHFAGRVAVLVGPENSSATFLFALIARKYHVATLVGQPTGGNRRGINGGSFYFVRLPHSQLEVDLPLVGNFPSSPQPNEGVLPDVYVKPTPQSIAANDDVELKRAFVAITSH